MLCSKVFPALPLVMEKQQHPRAHQEKTAEKTGTFKNTAPRGEQEQAPDASAESIRKIRAGIGAETPRPQDLCSHPLSLQSKVLVTRLHREPWPPNAPWQDGTQRKRPEGRPASTRETKRLPCSQWERQQGGGGHRGTLCA